jgi:hypothetical protein
VNAGGLRGNHPARGTHPHVGGGDRRSASFVGYHSSQMGRQHRLPHNVKQPNKYPANGYGGSATARQGGAREPGCEQTKRMIRADIIPALSWDLPIMPGKVMQGRPGITGGFGNGLLHSRPMPRRCMNQRPQAFPTLLHCPDSGQSHNPPDHLTNRRRRVDQPQVPLLKPLPGLLPLLTAPPP